MDDPRNSSPNGCATSWLRPHEDGIGVGEPSEDSGGVRPSTYAGNDNIGYAIEEGNTRGIPEIAVIGDKGIVSIEEYDGIHEP